MPVKDEADPDYRQREEKDGMTAEERKSVNDFLKKHVKILKTMAKNNNVIEEIQELIQQIKADYQEGADFEFVTPNLIKKASKGVHIKILSPRVKKFCREKFNFPHGIDNLDYEKGDQEGTDFYYRVNANNSNDD
ncbi:1975_t:CDS:2 [Ambispora leptoticha]|uniref:1975_t:CDS:1 n=1 Tax=Ambispora leptoticha TaxID=144679 RepID=A0A9N9H5F6_9GLOM|nr:1975_t:CDS:2 [Ambispora leptoticha]